jgi:hypothetical protein
MHQLNGERQNTHVVLRINVMERNKLIIKKKGRLSDANKVGF